MFNLRTVRLLSFVLFSSADDRAALFVGDVGGARGARLPGPDATGIGPAAPRDAVD